MTQRSKAATPRRKRRTRPASPAAELTADEIRARAGQLGLRVTQRLDALLPQARCTAAERLRAEEMARAAGMTLTQFVRHRVIAAAPAPGHAT